MCLGEVIIGDGLETLKMPFGRQMVHGNTGATYISRKMELCSMWNAGGWDPVFVHVHVFHCGWRCRWPWSHMWTRDQHKGPILKQNNGRYEMTNSMDRYMNNVPFLHIKAAWSLKPIAILRMLSLWEVGNCLLLVLMSMIGGRHNGCRRRVRCPNLPPFPPISNGLPFLFSMIWQTWPLL